MRTRIELLDNFPARWVFWWVLMPNLALIAMWFVGGPNMTSRIIMAGVAALVFGSMPNRLVRTAGIVAIFAFLLISYFSRVFYLTVDKAFTSLVYLGEMNLSASPSYVVGGAVLALAFGLCLWFAPRTERPRGFRQFLLAFVCVALLAQADERFNSADRGGYMVKAPEGTPIESAMLTTAISPETLGTRNLVVIILESVGVPANDHDRAIFDAIWNADKWAPHYTASYGEVPFYGSTTNAEIRELCEAWDDPTRFDFDSANCVPHRFAQAGFETTALHGFTPEFFDRRDWYPRVGFENVQFGPDLVREGAQLCDGVFTGVCDREFPREIAAILGREPQKRKLVYWLTLSGHLPVDDNASMQLGTCNLGTPEWREAFPMLCRSYMLQRQIADALREEIDSPGFADTDVLIVGDHIPPFFQRSIRSRFKTGLVPFIYLRRQQDVAGPAA